MKILMLSKMLYFEMVFPRSVGHIACPYAISVVDFDSALMWFKVKASQVENEHMP